MFFLMQNIFIVPAMQHAAVQNLYIPYVCLHV